MHRLTFSLPDELAAVVADQADRDGTSVSEVVRRADLVLSLDRRHMLAVRLKSGASLRVHSE